MREEENSTPKSETEVVIEAFKKSILPIVTTGTETLEAVANAGDALARAFDRLARAEERKATAAERQNEILKEELFRFNDLFRDWIQMDHRR